MAYMDPMGLTSVMKIFHEGGVLGEHQVSTHDMEDEIIILPNKKNPTMSSSKLPHTQRDFLSFGSSNALVVSFRMCNAHSFFS